MLYTCLTWRRAALGLAPLRSCPVVTNSPVADYALLRPLDLRIWGAPAYECGPPSRLGLDGGEVTVVRFGVDGGGWMPAWGDVEFALKTVAGVTSDHLLRLIEAGADRQGSGGYVVSESIRGSLAAPGPHRQESDLIRAIADAALGAHALHEAGVAHGAVNRASILFTDHGGVLAPPVPTLPPGVILAMSDWRDLVTYSPDVLAGQPPARTSDIWSLGATLHLVLSPRPLFAAIASEAPATGVQRILFTRPEVDPALPPPVAEVIASCLAPDPADRFSTAAEVAERLRQGLTP